MAKNFVGGLGFFVGVGPGIDERADALVAVVVGDGDFVKIGLWVARDAEDLDAVFACRFEIDRCEIGDDVGRNVFVRIAHFVEKLLFDGLNVDAAAGVVVFGDDELAVRPLRAVLTTG